MFFLTILSIPMGKKYWHMVWSFACVVRNATNIKGPQNFDNSVGDDIAIISTFSVAWSNRPNILWTFEQRPRVFQFGLAKKRHESFLEVCFLWYSLQFFS